MPLTGKGEPHGGLDAVEVAAFALRKCRAEGRGATFKPYVLHGGVQASGVNESKRRLPISVNEPRNGYSLGTEQIPFRTGFIQMYQATASVESRFRRM